MDPLGYLWDGLAILDCLFDGPWTRADVDEGYCLACMHRTEALAESAVERYYEGGWDVLGRYDEDPNDFYAYHH